MLSKKKKVGLKGNSLAFPFSRNFFFNLKKKFKNQSAQISQNCFRKTKFAKATQYRKPFKVSRIDQRKDSKNLKANKKKKKKIKKIKH